METSTGTRIISLAFEVCKSGNSWTAVVVCDMCGDDISSSGVVQWLWEDEEDDKRYSFALPVVSHETCATKSAILSRASSGEMIKMDLREYVSLLLLKFPLSPALSHGNSTHENKA